jgi:uncharacterized protein
MPNIGHFMIPADNVDRARKFYTSLLGWKIEPVSPAAGMEGIAAMQYHDISTGAAREGTMNTGGLYKRHLQEPVLDFVMVENIDAVEATVEKLGGKITMPKNAIKGVGKVLMILDTEGNVIGILEPERE